MQKETPVQPMLDFGSTIASFYRTQSTGNTIVTNIPYSCMHSIDFTEVTRMVHIRTTVVAGLDGASLIAFLIRREVIIVVCKHA